MNISVAPLRLPLNLSPVEACHSKTHGMKPEKSKKAKTPAKQSRTSAKDEATAGRAAPRRTTALKSAKAAVAKLKSLVAPARKAPTPKKPKASAPETAALSNLVVPPILLEGDAPVEPRASGPGQRYVLGTSEPAASETEPLELPEAYGTQRLMLVARDPRWLYAHWDLTADQLRQHNSLSRDKHLIVRVFGDRPAGKPVVEQHVHPESRNWFIHVGRGGAKYVAELGYYNRHGNWNTIATSSATVTPPDALSDDTSVRFETIPVEVPFKKLLELIKGAVTAHEPLVEALRELRTMGFPELPWPSASGSVPHWTPEQERALAQIVSIDEVRRVWMGSLEITELIRRSLEREISSQAAAALARGEHWGLPEWAGLSSVSSPFGGAEQRKGFWFNVNAELIIYGATEPDAVVTIGGRKIQLRRDGSFSFRFALPDGSYDLPVQATAADNRESRSARLHFHRATEYRGDVGRHPQDARLKTPRVENVA